MRYNKLFLIFTFFILMVSLTGCQLAREESTGSGKFTEDQMIGVYITREHLDLFDMEGFLNDNSGRLPQGNIDDLDSEEYQGRIYATLRKESHTDEKTGETYESSQYVFEHLDGIPYFAALIRESEELHTVTGSTSDEVISDSQLGVNVLDNEEKTTLEGTIYVSPKKNEELLFFFNPVFQDGEGKVYLVSGDGLLINGQSEGAAAGRTFDSTTTITRNGASKKKSISVKISFEVLFPPEKIVVMEMSNNSAVVSRNEYAPGEFPKEMKLSSDTEYIVVETYKNDPEGKPLVSRSITNSNEEYLNTFFYREDGFCIKKGTVLYWNNSK
ncbi:hypothetical protein ACPWSR_04780 [Alloiococcus sp. CFN-8]|uniref:hypothetical protein n=1 Tax=Alloiococcus sp. CFN-8 TaxID=3416081 RepID=UPI003CEA3F90